MTGMKPSGAGLEERTSAVAEHVAFEDFPNSGADLLRNMHAENAFVSGSNGTGFVPADKPFAPLRWALATASRHSSEARMRSRRPSALLSSKINTSNYPCQVFVYMVCRS